MLHLPSSSEPVMRLDNQILLKPNFNPLNLLVGSDPGCQLVWM